MLSCVSKRYSPSLPQYAARQYMQQSARLNTGASSCVRRPSASGDTRRPSPDGQGSVKKRDSGRMINQSRPPKASCAAVRRARSVPQKSSEDR